MIRWDQIRLDCSYGGEDPVLPQIESKILLAVVRVQNDENERADSDEEHVRRTYAWVKFMPAWRHPSNSCVCLSYSTYRQDTRMSESPAETDRLWCDFSSVLALLGSIRWGNGFFVSVGLADEPQVWHHSCWLPNDFARIDVLNSFLWRPNKSWLDSSQSRCIYRSSLLERIQTFELCSPEWMTVAIAKSTTRLLSCSLMKSQSTLHIFIVVCTCSCKNTQNTDIWTCFKTYANSEPSWFIVSQNEGSISWRSIDICDLFGRDLW